MRSRPTTGGSRFVACLVPFCTRGYWAPPTDHSDEAICGDHWRLVDSTLKRSRTRRLKELEGDDDARNAAGWHYWRAIKRQAIERAAGID